MNGNKALVKYFIEERHVDPHSVADPELLLSYSVDRGDLDLVKYFVEEQHFDPGVVSHGYSLVSLAAHNSFNGMPSLGMVKYFLEDCKVKVKEEHELEMLEDACGIKNKEAAFEIVRYLLERGFKIFNESLYWVARNGNVKLLKFLIEEQKLDPNYTNKHRWSVLFAGIAHLEIVKYLCEICKVNVNEADEGGFFALDWACDNVTQYEFKLVSQTENCRTYEPPYETIRSIAQYLLSRGARFNKPKPKGEYAEQLGLAA